MGTDGRAIYFMSAIRPMKSERKSVRFSHSALEFPCLPWLHDVSEKSEMVSFSAMPPPSIGRVSGILQPPAFRGDDKALIAEQHIVARMANALYAHYDELRLNSFSWAYWHAVCAPVHMAAGHFGAAIEALQNGYMKAHPAKLDQTLIADKVSGRPQRGIPEGHSGGRTDLTVGGVLTNKVKSNLNRRRRCSF